MKSPESQGQVFEEKSESYKFQLRNAYGKMRDLTSEGGDEYAGKDARNTSKYKYYEKQALDAFVTLKALIGVEEAQAFRSETRKEILGEEAGKDPQQEDEE